MKTFIEKVRYKIKQYYEGYILKKPEAKLALDFLRKDKIYDFRHNYQLPRKPIIFDCGGFKGDWTAKMLSKHPDAEIHIFEIAQIYIEYLIKRFDGVRTVHVYPFGLGADNKQIEFAIDDVATGIFSKKNVSSKQQGEVKRVDDFLKENRIDRIDLLKMNIEGGEYELLDALIKSNFIRKCLNVQIQFHNYGEWSVVKRDELKSELRKTHDCTYDFEWTFENWRLQ